MKRFLFYVLIALIMLLSLSACSGKEKGVLGPDASPEAVPDLAGSYVVNGFDPLGTEYSGHLTIWAGDEAGSYRLQWIIVGSIQEGSGKVEGNQLIVNWHSIQGFAGESRGTAIYTITVNGELYGERAVEGYEPRGTETAFPNP